MIQFVTFKLLEIYSYIHHIILHYILSSRLGLHRLGEVGAHETLEVEVGELVLSTELEKRGKLGIRVDLATIAGILEVVGADVSVDVAGNSRARHLGALLLAKEGGKLVTDASGLDEAAGGTVAGLALALGALLLNRLELAAPLLLKRTELSLQGRDEGAHLLKLGEELEGLLLNGGLELVSNNRLLLDGGGLGRNSGLDSLGLLLSLGLLGLHSLLHNGSGGLNSRGSRLSLLYVCLRHIILYLDEYLLSDLGPYIIYCHGKASQIPGLLIRKRIETTKVTHMLRLH